MRVGVIRENLKLIGYTQGAVAQYRYRDNTVKIYYQTMPISLAKTSIYTRIMRQYNINVRLRRPDILIEINSDKNELKLVEVKRTSNHLYIGESLYKVLGYLKDFENCFESANRPQALLVVWKKLVGTNNDNDIIVILDREAYQAFFQKKIIEPVSR